jgi:hypothetical protein
MISPSEPGARCEFGRVKNNNNLNDDRAGCAATNETPELFADRMQMQTLDSLRGTCGAGRPGQNLLRERLLQDRAGVGPETLKLLLQGLDDGRTIYWRRKSGKVASFFRCLLR